MTEPPRPRKAKGGQTGAVASLWVHKLTELKHARDRAGLGACGHASGEQMFGEEGDRGS